MPNLYYKLAKVDDKRRTLRATEIFNFVEKQIPRSIVK